MSTPQQSSVRSIQEIENFVFALKDDVNFIMKRRQEIFDEFKDLKNAGLVPTKENDQDVVVFKLKKEEHYAYEHHLTASIITFAIYGYELTEAHRFQEPRYSTIIAETYGTQDKIKQHLSKYHSTSCRLHKNRSVYEYISVKCDFIAAKRLLIHEKQYEKEHNKNSLAYKLA
ncbi:hypothetical protein BDA99DRAFT_539117 [Phascolomyces articulosus]|uniref:Uncharacterized protein n=1 Tax=Phascolomyces articulosus TaxID=60185 RepID=A0AAD5PCP2_9FUNG|nr:hypothetical protein BDA99DRAFT_539117 [Phascolomyces articulosus]